MLEQQKSPDIRKEAPRRKVEEPSHVQERRKLSDAQGLLKSNRESLSRALRGEQTKKQQRKDQENARAGIDQALGSSDILPGPTSTEIETPQHPIDENVVLRARDAVEKNEKTYQAQFDRTFTEERKALEKLPDEQKKLKTAELEKKYLDGYSSDMLIGQKPLREEGIKYLSTTFPVAWKETLLDSKSVEKNPELKKVRENILSRIPLYAEINPTNFARVQEQIQEATGITISDMNEAKNFLEQAKVNSKDIEEKNGIKGPTPDDYTSKEQYDSAVSEYRQSNPGAPNTSGPYTPMTPSENFNASSESGGTSVESGSDFRTWLESETTKIPEQWKGIAKEFLSKLSGESPKTGTPILLASATSRRALFLQNGQWQEFPVIFGSGGMGNGKGQTPVESIAKFHSVKIAQGENPNGDASITGSSTVKGASLLSSLGESQGGKWWHGVNPSRLNGGHTAGCVGLDPNLAIKFAQSIQSAGNRGYGYVSRS